MAKLIMNGRAVDAAPGDTLVDAGMAAGIYLPHDCCAGQCETCRVKVVGGAVDEAGTRERDTVLACMAKVTDDAEIVFDQMPPPVTRKAEVKSVRPLSPEIDEVVLALDKDIDIRNGQYVSVAFYGYPARDFSPAPGLDGKIRSHEMFLHIRRDPAGAVSSKIGTDIAAGHPAKVTGPFGRAWLRPGTGRVVLVSGGTGFAPLFGIACDALASGREVVAIAGARSPANVYMRAHAAHLAAAGASVVLTASGIGEDTADIRSGRPTSHVPALRADDTVFACGTPAMVQAVRALAAAADCECYADPFVASSRRPGVMHAVQRFVWRWRRVA